MKSTLRVKREGFEIVQGFVDRDERFVLCFFHRRLVMMPVAYPFKRKNAAGERRGVAILSSDSKDGERSAATWRWYGIHAVRGTTGHSGAQALVKMIQIVKQGWDLGITVDGPRGPRQRVKPGVLAVSRKTGAWLVPVCVAYTRAWKLNTWDEMLVPKPFSKVVVYYGEPFRITDARTETAHQADLEAKLNELETRAESLNG
ncbi:MAG: lysophospholipid acyltransferase family protein [Holophaga sp.]|nr:lysophospholipid acyltransferase family protein [Holophaga sp.]